MKGFLLHKKNGVTLIEIIMVVAVMGVLFLGLFSLINKVTKGAWQIGAMLGMNSSASEAMYWIGNDFRNAKASSMGNFGPNPGFEDPIQPINPPTGWEPLHTSARRNSGGGIDIKGGIKTMELFKGPTTYMSNSFLLNGGKNYVLSSWLKAGANGAMQFINSAGGGVVASTQPITTPPWPVWSSSPVPSPWKKHFTTFNLAANTTGYLRLADNSATGFSWPKGIEHITEGGNFARTAIETGADNRPIAVYYVENMGIRCAWWGASGWTLKTVVQHNTSWPTTYSDGFYGLDMKSVGGMPVLAYTSFSTGLLHSLDFARWNGSTWNIQTVDNGGGTNRVGDACSIAIDTNGMAHIAYLDGTNFDLKYAKQTGLNTWSISTVTGNALKCRIVVDSANNPAIAYQQGATWDMKWAHWNGANWDFETIGATTNNSSGAIGMVLDNVGRYHVIYNNGSPGQMIYARRDGPSSWFVQNTNTLGVSGSGYASAIGIDSNNSPQIGFYNWSIFPCEVSFYRWNGSTWAGGGVCVDHDLTSSSMVLDMVLDNEDIAYISFIDKTPWYDIPSVVSRSGYFFDDAAISPTQVILSSSTTDTNYEYYTCTGISVNESNRFKRYRLNYTPIADRKDPTWPGILRRQWFEGGSWINDGQEKFCNNVKQLTISNNKQESFDVELILEKVIDASQTKEYRIKSRFTPAVP